MTAPPKRITDPSFRYTPSVKTDVAATFRRVRKQMELAKQLREEAARREPVQLRKRA